jgi:hypothetical protein
MNTTSPFKNFVEERYLQEATLGDVAVGAIGARYGSSLARTGWEAGQPNGGKIQELKAAMEGCDGDPVCIKQIKIQMKKLAMHSAGKRWYNSWQSKWHEKPKVVKEGGPRLTDLEKYRRRVSKENSKFEQNRKKVLPQLISKVQK